MKVTVGQLYDAIEALTRAGFVMASGGIDLGNVGDDEAVGEDVLTAVAVFWPPAATLAIALPIALAIAKLAIDNPGSGGNTAPLPPHGGRRA